MSSLDKISSLSICRDLEGCSPRIRAENLSAVNETLMGSIAFGKRCDRCRLSFVAPLLSFALFPLVSPSTFVRCAREDAVRLLFFFRLYQKRGRHRDRFYLLWGGPARVFLLGSYLHERSFFLRVDLNDPLGSSAPTPPPPLPPLLCPLPPLKRTLPAATTTSSMTEFPHIPCRSCSTTPKCESPGGLNRALLRERSGLSEGAGINCAYPTDWRVRGAIRTMEQTAWTEPLASM